MTSKNSYPAAATDDPVYEIDSFELLWEQHKSKILAAVAALVLLVLGAFGWMFFSHAQRVDSEKAFAAAKTGAEYQAVIAKYPSSVVAGDAALLLAKSLRDEKKYDDANAVLDQFVKSQPKHPFAPLARVAAAENLALAGKVNDAVKALEAVVQTDGASFAAPFALLVSAELKSAQGDREGALRFYRNLAQTFPASTATRASASAYQALEALSPQPSAAAPATTAPAVEP